MTILLLYIFYFLPLWLKEFLLWLYIWQKKEYRGDKMMDYLRLLEAKKLIFSPRNLPRLLSAILFLVTYGLFWVVNYLENIDFTRELATSFGLLAVVVFLALTSLVSVIAVAISYLDIFVFFQKSLKGKQNLPKFTAKALLGSAFFWITFLPLTIYFASIYNNLFHSFLPLITVAIPVGHFIGILIPLLIGYWFLILFPLDYYAKNQVFKKAKTHRKSLDNLNVIAISGAYGKSTTKELLDQILSLDKKVVKTLKNQNSNISCAKKTLSLTSEIDYFICELGAYKVGDGNEISNFILPTQSVITGLNIQHYSLFGSEQNVINAESESLAFLPEESKAFLNWSSKMVRKITIPAKVKPIKYGLPITEKEISEFHYYAKDITFDGKETSFILVHGKKTYNLKTNLFSRGNIENLTGALAVALENGLDINRIKPILTELEPPYGSLASSQEDYGMAIDDSYNANYDGIKNAIEATETIAKNKNFQFILYLDEILELGDKSREYHIKIAEHIVAHPPDLVILLGRNFSHLIRQRVLETGFDSEKLLIWNGKNETNIKNQVNTFIKRKPGKNIILYEGFQSRKFKM